MRYLRLTFVFRTCFQIILTLFSFFQWAIVLFVSVATCGQRTGKVLSWFRLEQGATQICKEIMFSNQKCLLARVCVSQWAIKSPKTMIISRETIISLTCLVWGHELVYGWRVFSRNISFANPIRHPPIAILLRFILLVFFLLLLNFLLCLI